MPNTKNTKGSCLLVPIDYVQLAFWWGLPQNARRRTKGPRFKGNLPAKAGQSISQYLGDFHWEDYFVHVYTDGPCHNQQYPWLRRTGAGVFWGREHPLNTAINQGGQAHTSPRAELLAIVIAIEQSRWPIHIYSDNFGFVVATQKLLSGEPTNALKDNFDVWARIKRRLNANRKHIRITWNKGHSTEADITKGNSSIAHHKGTNAADELANAGYKMLALPDLFLKSHI